jgi:acyl carrier protein
MGANNMDSELANIKQNIKRELADFLGIGLEDIEDESEFESDFHMNAVQITDFVEILGKAGFNTQDLDFNEIDTFSELVDALTAHF